MTTADNAAKAVHVLQFFFVCAAVLSYILSFLVAHLFFLGCPGRAVLSYLWHHENTPI